MKVAIIPADDTQPIRFEDIEGRLKEFQEIVGGYIEGVHLRTTPYYSAINFYCNEDGIAQGLPGNHRASMLYRWGVKADPTAVIHGDVVCYGGEDYDGNSHGLSETQVKDLHRLQRLTED